MPISIVRPSSALYRLAEPTDAGAALETELPVPPDFVEADDPALSPVDAQPREISATTQERTMKEYFGATWFMGPTIYAFALDWASAEWPGTIPTNLERSMRNFWHVSALNLDFSRSRKRTEL